MTGGLLYEPVWEPAGDAAPGGRPDADVVEVDGPDQALAALAGAEGGEGRRLWLLTRGVMTDPAAAAAWGLAGVASLELPALRVGAADGARDVLAPLLGGEEDALLAGPDGAVLVRRLRALAGPARQLTLRGAHLVTGGGGGLGLEIAARLARRGAQRVVLLQRSAAAPHALARLRALGAEAVAVQGDVRDPGDVAAAVEAAGDLRGIVHAAGTAIEAPLAQLTAADVEEAVAVKAGGFARLCEAAAGHELDLLVACSSLTGIVGLPGQGAYAAANAALDAAVRAAGAPAQSLAFGAWAQVGGAEARGAAKRLRRLGLPPLEPADALDALESAVAGARPHVVVADVDWQRLADVLWLGSPPPLLSGVLPGNGRLESPPCGGAGPARWSRRFATGRSARPTPAR